MGTLLELESVCKHYPKFDLKDVSFSVPAGSIVGFIGRNGAGKTTTLKGIMNLVHFDSGSVRVFEKDMTTNELDIKQKIGFSLSELNFYPNKTINQINSVSKMFYKDYSDEKFDKLCDLFKLNRTKKLEQLSSGMKVKFSLAQALSHNAQLLILDEPTSGLDPISRDEVLDIFESIVKKENRAILFSTHITSDLDKCATHIVYIKEGKIIYKGTKADFVSSYLLFETSKSSFKKSDLIISYKEHGERVEGLIKTENKEKCKDLKLKTPDLEQIMVYLEREGQENEEFDF